MEIQKIEDCVWELPKSGEMRVPGRIFASESMISKIKADKTIEQVANVATLPGIQGYSLAMPDAHWGYGFSVGGVAATDISEGGVISPGGIGFDISCGIRLLRTDLKAQEVLAYMEKIMDALFHQVPSGVGSTGRLRLNTQEMRRVFVKGAQWSIEQGYGWSEDIETIEDEGRLDGANPEIISERAMERGREQMGTLGSGNHFLEVQRVDAVYDQESAATFGLFEGQLVILIHTGSRGCGYQVCDDFLSVMLRAASKYQIRLPDKQLCCAPLNSPEGKDYFSAMACAANFARANRQVITYRVREAFRQVLGKDPRGMGMSVVYDVCHNIAKIEEHEVEGRKRRLCVHRKGATRAFPAGHPEVPVKYRGVGQPVLLPGSMGTASFVLVGTAEAMRKSFGTTAHGAGREMSRAQASKKIEGHKLQQELKSQGILVRTDSYRGLAEEAPFAYKDVCEVADACEKAGLSRKVARLRPLGVVKG